MLHKKVILVSTILFCCFIGFSQNPPIAGVHLDETEYDNFQGQVKKCEIRTVDSDGSVVTDFMNYNQDLLYDEAGRLIMRNNYLSDRSNGGIKVETYWKYIYESNKLDKVLEKWSDTDEFVLRNFYSYEQDSITTRFFITESKDTLTTFAKIKEGSKIIKKRARKGGELKTATITENGNSDKVKVVQFYNSSSEVYATETTTSEVDAVGNKIMNVVLHNIKKGTETKKRIVEDKNGRLISLTNYDEGDKIKSELVPSYKYDENNNWIEMSMEVKNPFSGITQTKTTTRKIEYY